MRITTAVLVTSLLVSCAASAAETLQIQAESYIDYLNLDGMQISVSGGNLIGLDRPGEWTYYAAAIQALGTYRIRMKCWGDYDTPYELHMQFTDSGGGLPQTIQFYFTGTGCGG